MKNLEKHVKKLKTQIKEADKKELAEKAFDGIVEVDKVLKKKKLLPKVKKITGKVVKVGNKLGINKEKTKK